MLEKVLQSILRRYFGQFLTGLENVALAFWTGKIHIESASFKHEKINELLKTHNIPLTIKYSFIGSLDIDVPWKNLSSAPVEIKINDVFIVFNLQKINQRKSQLEDFAKNAKILIIKNYITHLLKKSEEYQVNDQEQEDGYLKKLMIKILHNLNLQIDQVHIRIENEKKQLFFDIEEQQQTFRRSGTDFNRDINFSLGFCVEKIEAFTTNEADQKSFVNIQNDLARVRKNIFLKEISFYWEEDDQINLFECNQDKKNDILRHIIYRKDHRLMTIDGNVQLEKNKDHFHYYFTSNIHLLHVELNYQQIKQIIKVHQQFVDATTKRNLNRMRELEYENQLHLEKQYKNIFTQLHQSNFTLIDYDTIKVMQSVDTKLLLKWSRDEIIEIIKKQKVEEARKQKNKKGWFGFLSKETNLDLTEDDIKQIQNQIKKLIKIVEEGDKKRNIGFSLKFQKINLAVNHKKKGQKIVVYTKNIEVSFKKILQSSTLNLKIFDFGLYYENLRQNSRIQIVSKSISDGENELIVLEYVSEKMISKLLLVVESITINHQIKVLSFLSDIYKLKEEQANESNLNLIQANVAKASPEQLTEIEKKTYEYDVEIKSILVILELDEHSELNLELGGLVVKQERGSKGEQYHRANMINIAVMYSNSNEEGHVEIYKIIDYINIEVQLINGFKKIISEIDQLKIELNEEELQKIYQCIQAQVKILKIQRKEQRSFFIEDQKYHEGETKIMNVFKNWKTYRTVLLRNQIHFYDHLNKKDSYDHLNKKDSYQPANVIPITNTTIKRVNDKTFKIQSLIINQIIQCSNKEETDRWIYLIQQRIFENNSKMKMFQLIEDQSTGENMIPNQEEVYKYKTVVKLEVKHIKILYQKNTSQKILELKVKALVIELHQDNLSFHRQIDIHQIQITNMSLDSSLSQQYKLLLSNTFTKVLPENQDINHPIQIHIEGKKKLNPEYNGQLKIKCFFHRLFVNFNAEVAYEIISKLEEKENVTYTDQIRDRKILEMIKDILVDEQVVEDKFEKAKNLDNYKQYVDINKYRALFSCHVLFHVEICVDQAQIYLVNGRNNFWMNEAHVSKFQTSIDKGTNFFFLKTTAENISILDITGYPHTIKQPFSKAKAYPLIKQSQKRLHKNSVEVYFSSFDQNTFINKQRFRSFLELNIFDVQINYQQQPIMRLIDFLTNQIIFFLMDSFTLHKYDTPKRGSFVFHELNFQEKEVFKILLESIHPFFNHLTVNASHLDLNLNSHPGDQLIPFHIENVKVTTHNYKNANKIHLNLNQYNKIYKANALFQELTKNLAFEDKILKNQWANRLIISAESIRSTIFQNQFNFHMFFQRALHGDKTIILPFIKVDKDFVMEGKIKNMNLVSPRSVYNLINKCFMFNLSYDDNCDNSFNTNSQFQHLSPQSGMSLVLKIDELALVIPEVNQTVIVIQKCEYKFLKNANQAKVMQVNGKSLHILGKQQNNLITPLNFQESKGLEYIIEMKPSGQKIMSTFIRQIDISYNQDIFLKLGKFLILDDTCYPPQDTFPDLPLITCHVYLLNSYFKILETTDFIYTLRGDISLTWTRNKIVHPQVYKDNKSLFPNKKEQSSYEVSLMEINFRKYKKDYYQKKIGNYRSLSSPISMKLRMSNVMKISAQGVSYTDLVASYNIDVLILKLSYQDIREMMEGFGMGGEENQKVRKNSMISKQSENVSSREGRNSMHEKVASLGYLNHTEHKATITKFSFQIGLSELPVPLLDLSLESTQIKYELIGEQKVITNSIQCLLTYWNMGIGRWEPIIQRMFIDVTLRFSKREKYLMITSNNPIMLNFSIESLKVMKLVHKDIQENGNLHIVGKEEKAKGVQVSPYVITNRTGLNISITSEAIIDVRLKNNEKIHLQSQSLEIVENNFNSIFFEIEGDETNYEINLSIANPTKLKIKYSFRDYELFIEPVSSSILKEIIISSPYIFHNQTAFPLMFILGKNQYAVEPSQKLAIPFLESMQNKKSFKLEFPHLNKVTQNYIFELLDVENDYEHYIVQDDGKVFNCIVKIEKDHLQHQQKQNLSTIAVCPVFCFQNLLPIDMTIEISLTKVNQDKEGLPIKQIINQSLQVSQVKQFYEFGTKDETSMRIKIKGFNFSSFEVISTENQAKQSNQIQFVDHRGTTSYVKYKIIKESRTRKIFFYTDSVLINQSPYPLFIFNQGNLIAGQRITGVIQSQTKFVFMNSMKNMRFSFDDVNGLMSSNISTIELGNQQIAMQRNNQLYEILINNTIHCLDEKAEIYTNILKITPRYILVNKTTRQMVVKQVNTEKEMYFRVEEMKDWVWTQKDQFKHISLRLVNNQIENQQDAWDYSAPLDLQKIEDMVFVLRPKNKSKQRFLMKLELIRQSQQVFILIKQLKSKEESFYNVQNNLKMINVRFYQQYLETVNSNWIHYKHFECDSLQSIEFGWDFPFEKHVLKAEIIFLGPLRSKYENDIITIDLQESNSSLSYIFTNEDGHALQITISIQTLGLRKHILLDRKDNEALQQQLQLMQMPGNKLGLSLSEIGISLITGKKVRSEIVFISIRKCQSIMTQRLNTRSLEVKIKYINIDNNSNHNTIYPIMLTPLKYQKTMNKTRPFFVILLEQNLKQKKITEVKEFRMCLEPISLKIYDQVLMKIYQMTRQFQNLEEKNQKADLNLIFRTHANQLSWQEHPLIKHESEIFFKEFEIGKLQIEISFSIRPNNNSNFIIFTILSSFGAAISNVSESQLTLSRFIRKDITLNEIINQISEFYRKEFIKQIYKVLGSINLFGNPYVFIRYFAEGTWQIVNQPTEGFIKGPIEGVIGIGKGGVYFTRNVVAGTFNSLQAIGQSLSRGISFVTMDQKFIERREKIKIQKSNHVIEGVRDGLFSVYTGFQVAITGLARHPVEDYRKSGILGGVTGIFKGVAGLLTKPISGIFEGVSKLSEGIKNTALMFQDGPNLKRSRPPRIFISELQYYTEYNYLKSYTIALLEHQSTKFLNSSILYISVDEKPESNQIWSWVLTKKYLIEVEIKEKKIHREIEMDEIEDVTISDNVLHITTERQQIIIKKGKELFEAFKLMYDI